jgi:hypothetical protein
MTITSMSTLEQHTVRSTRTAPPCAQCPDNWDLDAGSPETWRSAVQTCRDCPLLGECAELAATLTSRGQAPRAMIWAGVGYDNSGNVIACLDRYRVLPINVKRPTVIIRNRRASLSGLDGTTERAQAVPAVGSGRKIVLRRIS